MSNFNTLWIGKNRDRGSILSTKNYQNSDKILRFLKISFYFQNVFGSKYSEENFRKSVQPAAPKYFVWKFLRFSEKICGFKILRFLSENFSELRFILIGLSPEKSLLTYLLTQKIFDICLLLESKLLANNELNWNAQLC